MTDKQLHPEWRDPSARTALGTNDIDIWLIDLDASPGDINLLTADEQQRAARLVVPIKRAQFIAGRSALRRILARYVDTVAFDYGEFGKPALRDSDAPVFNLSHSEHLALLAVCPEGLLGIDIEHERAVRKIEKLAIRFFAPAESQRLMELPEAQRATAFYHLWTCKEAYLKARGTGLSFPSNGFVIDDSAPQPAKLVSSDMLDETDPTTWRFVDLPVPESFAAALCWQHGDKTLRLWRSS